MISEAMMAERLTMDVSPFIVQGLDGPVAGRVCQGERAEWCLIWSGSGIGAPASGGQRPPADRLECGHGRPRTRRSPGATQDRRGEADAGGVPRLPASHARVEAQRAVRRRPAPNVRPTELAAPGPGQAPG